MKIYILAFAFCFLVLFPAISQSETKEIAQPEHFPLGFYAGSSIIMNNPEKGAIHAPTGTSLTAGLEYEALILKHFAIIPSLDFSIFHYLWQNEKASLAEQENRTALTLAFLADLPFMSVFKLDRWTISLGGGAAIFMRAAVLEPGIKADEVNNGLTAKEEVKKINTYLWNRSRWLYPSLRFKTEYTFSSGWKTGGLFALYIPVFNLWSGNNTPFSDSLMIKLCLTLYPPKRKSPSTSKNQ